MRNCKTWLATAALCTALGACTSGKAPDHAQAAPAQASNGGETTETRVTVEREQPVPPSEPVPIDDSTASGSEPASPPPGD